MHMKSDARPRNELLIRLCLLLSLPLVIALLASHGQPRTAAAQVNAGTTVACDCTMSLACDITESREVFGSEVAADDQFGNYISVDGTLAVVGANRADCQAGGECGAVYVFQRGLNGWVEDQMLSASDAGAGDQFGRRVSISGELVVVGAGMADCNDGADCGAAYVFRRAAAGTWVEQQILAASDGAAGDNYGYAVHSDGDRILIGAENADCVGGVDCGRVYAYHHNGSSWVEDQKLTASDEDPDQTFGRSVFVSGNRAVVGAPRVDCGAGIECGAVYFFEHDGSSWSERDRVAPADLGASDRFGWSVVIDGNTAMVGAIAQDCISGADCGAVYVYTHDGSHWSFAQKLTASDSALEFDLFFGGHVWLRGDTAVIGSPRADCGAGTSCGRAYLFRYDGASWIEQAILSASGAADADAFGRSISGNGTSVLIGAIRADCGAGADCGAVYEYDIVGADADCDGIIDVCDPEISLECLAACCLPEGCSNLSTAACEAQGGCPQPDTLCGVGNQRCFWTHSLCPDSPCDCAACCLPDQCRNLALDECRRMGGCAQPGELCGHQGQVCESVRDISHISDSCTAASQDCLTTSDEPGCGTGWCCAIVCEVDSFCCSETWDSQCVTSAETECATPDCNLNGFDDALDIASGQSGDCNSNAMPDECEISSGVCYSSFCFENCRPDDNGDGVPDECQTADCNENGVLDFEEIDTGAAPDCDNDGVPDVCQIQTGSPAPGGPFFCTDSCDPDCNSTGTPDACDLLNNDCDNNEIPDECQPDTDGDSTIDACDDDIDGDGIPNETDLCDFTPLGVGVDPSGRPLGDIDQDCDTDLDDLRLFQQGFTGP